jgi:hypothetical protein
MFSGCARSWFSNGKRSGLVERPHPRTVPAQTAPGSSHSRAVARAAGRHGNGERGRTRSRGSGLDGLPPRGHSRSIPSGGRNRLGVLKANGDGELMAQIRERAWMIVSDESGASLLRVEEPRTLNMERI